MSAPDPGGSLLAALQEWARHALPAPPSGHGGPECQWCPLCQFAGVLRGEHPEITERLAEAGAAVSTAVRAFIESASAAMPTSDTSAPERPSRPRVERIVFDDDAPEG